MMRSFFLAVLTIIGLHFSPLPTGFSVTEAVACDHKTTICGNTADKITFQGDRQIKDQIKVEVCHGYWDLLDTGSYNGQNTKWWAAAMVYGNWYGDLPVVTNPCKIYWVKPGTELRLFAECVDRVISTGQMTRPGRYVMT